MQSLHISSDDITCKSPKPFKHSPFSYLYTNLFVLSPSYRKLLALFTKDYALTHFLHLPSKSSM